MRLNKALRKTLNTVLADDAHVVAARHSLKIGYLEVLPWPGRRLVTDWKSKSDLIDTIAASCNWPFFFSRWPFVWCRNALCLDGFFAVGRDRFGCPPLDADRTVAITALPKVELAAFEADARNLIQPDGRAFRSAPLPMDSKQWFSYALAPAADATIEEMVGLGRSHADIWAEAEAQAERESGRN